MLLTGDRECPFLSLASSRRFGPIRDGAGNGQVAEDAALLQLGEGGHRLQFTTITFWVLLVVVFLVHWLLTARARAQNLVLIVAACVFYGWFDVRFLAFLLGGTLVDFLVGVGLARWDRPGTRRLLLALSLTVNLGALAWFKYAGFLVGSARGLLAAVGLPAGEGTLAIALPLGISFFTLQRLSYVLDVFRGAAPPARDGIAFLATATFFPLLLSGPIERPARLLRQFRRGRVFDPEGAVDGLRRILLGLFKKLVIADRVAPAVHAIFSDPSARSGSELALGAALFGVQLYADFSGYSDMAIGCARLLGIRVMRNFAAPFFSRDIGEFWRRWHISLSTWLRDYIYTPLSWRTPLSSRWKRFWFILVTFLASGLWHGASWNFVLWGLLHGLFFAPLVFQWIGSGGDRTEPGPLASAIRGLLTFGGVSFAWILFRTETLVEAARYVTLMFTTSWVPVPRYPEAIALSVSFLLAEWLRRGHEHLLAGLPARTAERWAIYLVLALSVILLGGQGASPFLYAQF